MDPPKTCGAAGKTIMQDQDGQCSCLQDRKDEVRSRREETEGEDSHVLLRSECHWRTSSLETNSLVFSFLLRVLLRSVRHWWTSSLETNSPIFSLLLAGGQFFDSMFARREYSADEPSGEKPPPPSPPRRRGTAYGWKRCSHMDRSLKSPLQNWVNQAMALWEIRYKTDYFLCVMLMYEDERVVQNLSVSCGGMTNSYVFVYKW